jgi:PAS domain S-box-containing protein
MPGEIVVRDADSRIVFANQAFAEIYGLSVEQLIGKLDCDMWAANGRPAEQIAEWLAEDREILATGGSKEYVQEIVRANDERAYFHNRKKALNLADGRRYLLAQYADITDIKRIEQELARNKVLLAELAGIRKMSVTYSHEINNPLSGVLGLAQLMQEHEACPAEFHEMLKDLIEAARRIARVIEQLQHEALPQTREYLGRHELLDLKRDT